MPLSGESESKSVAIRGMTRNRSQPLLLPGAQENGWSDEDLLFWDESVIKDLECKS